MTRVLTDEESGKFDLAFARFRELIDADRIDALQPMGPQAVYTASVTVWLLIYQRLHAGGSLLDAVHELLRTDAALLPDNRRVRDGTLSRKTGSYSEARKRLQCHVTDDVAHHLFQSLVASFPTSLTGRRAFLLDGTTIALASTPALRKAFPPASNQHGEGTWPIAHLLVAHELESGCALLPELGAKFGPHAQSEAELAQALMRRLPERSIVIADRNFGIFSVAYAARRLEHDVLFRLTEQRFRALLRQAKVSERDQRENASERSWSLHWRPSKGDRQAHPELSADAAVDATLHEVRRGATTLWLLTTGPCTTAQAAELYGRRQDVETDIRNVKVVLDMERLPARSPTIMRKELAISIVAYNLVVQVRRLAAARAKVPPRRLSFASVWSAVRVILLSPQQWTAAEWRKKFELAVEVASHHKIPH
ncbi:MAG TPA: IS4 family transposase, partial [Verrucomicrobiae bacterium]|nr:IS4 family transposase [Verrucomicrobiae bacterium]